MSWIVWIAAAGWYATSALSGVTSKHILGSIDCPFTLSACQLTIAFGCHSWMAVISKPIKVFERKQNPFAHSIVLISSFAFTIGISSFNSGFGLMHVSINETLRALEPVVSVLLAFLYLIQPIPSRYRVISLLPVVFGVYLSAISNQAFTLWGLSIVMIANIAFPIRAVLVKSIQLIIPLNVNFYTTLYYAMLFQWGFVAVSMLYTRNFLRLFTLSRAEYLLLLLNGVLFYLYHLSSFFVLTATDNVTHSVVNAFRRVATILFSVFYFQHQLHPTNAIGMLVACCGALGYAYTLSIERRSQHQRNQQAHHIKMSDPLVV